jgi:hypothetical protein
MSRLEAQRLVRRIVSDTDFLLRLAHIEDDDMLDLTIRAEGFDCTWQEALDVYTGRSGAALESEGLREAG